MSNLTERERWLICQAFRQGYGLGHNDTVESVYSAACEHEDEGAIDWLDDYAGPGGVTVADVLAKEAPTTELAALERELAEFRAITGMTIQPIFIDDFITWIDIGNAPNSTNEELNRCVRYLELRGLLERHPERPELVRVMEGKDDE